MKQTQLFTKTSKNVSADEVSLNAQLLLQAGYVHKEMAGAYQWLPLGFLVLENIKKIIREEMNQVGGLEMLATTLQSKELWEKTNRWDDAEVDIWFKSTLKAGGEVGFGWSHEEPLANMIKSHISSYKDLPVVIYQFQHKLRNELRAKSGVMRGREFVMKDMYSFSDTEDQHNKIYEDVKQAYIRVFDRLGIGDDTFVTFASGGAFTEFSHEFQTICEAGEDKVYINKEKHIAINEEIFEKTDLGALGVSESELSLVKTAEVGNIFNFGRSKADGVGLLYKNQTGETLPVWMGSYGIGVTRLVGVLVEKFADEKGLVWSSEVSPFKWHLLWFGGEDTRQEAEKIYSQLIAKGEKVLFDDRVDVRPGEKLVESDLLGFSNRIVVSDRSLASGGVEYKSRTETESKIIKKDELLSFVDAVK